MIKTKQSDLKYLMKTMKLSDEEAKNATRFKNKHRIYTMENRSFNYIKYTISFYEKLKGSYVKIKC